MAGRPLGWEVCAQHNITHTVWMALKHVLSAQHNRTFQRVFDVVMLAQYVYAHHRLDLVGGVPLSVFTSHSLSRP